MVKTFKAKLDNLREMLGFIKREATLNGFDDKSLNRIELAAEEVLINIIQYGYPKHDGVIEIDCQTSGKAGIKIVITDQGVPFNPLENK
ncbi:MAG: ATP-binding protein, partial [Parachlamydiaceae bacterium]